MTDSASLYLDLLEQVLTRAAFLDEEVRDVTLSGWRQRVVSQLTSRGYRVVRPVDQGLRYNGRDWPPTAETMIGLARMRNLRTCVETVLADEVPGDLIETGIWRGGACIFIRAILAANAVTDRTVWCADSFLGLPPPRLAVDEGIDLNLAAGLPVSIDQVRRNFDRYGLLDDQVQFIEGWFSDSLPGPVKQLAVLRLDGDMYESTWDAITVLEPLVSNGGFVIVDDFGTFDACAQAIHDYRERAEITEPIIDIDGYGAYWRKG